MRAALHANRTIKNKLGCIIHSQHSPERLFSKLFYRFPSERTRYVVQLILLLDS
jgi:hypothetical protein